MWLLPIVAAILMIVGLARPQLDRSRTEVTANGIDIVLGLDVSGSMQALDFLIDNRRVNRIEVVKSVVSKFIDERLDDRIGILAFAGAPYLVSPLTLDHDWLQQNLERISVGDTEDGTAIGSAIVQMNAPGVWVLGEVRRHVQAASRRRCALEGQDRPAGGQEHTGALASRCTRA